MPALLCPGCPLAIDIASLGATGANCSDSKSFTSPLREKVALSRYNRVQLRLFLSKQAQNVLSLRLVLFSHKQAPQSNLAVFHFALVTTKWLSGRRVAQYARVEGNSRNIFCKIWTGLIEAGAWPRLINGEDYGQQKMRATATLAASAQFDTDQG